MWFDFLHVPRKSRGSNFLSTLAAGDTQAGLQLWKADPAITPTKTSWRLGRRPQQLLRPGESYRIEGASSPPRGGSGVVVTARSIATARPFPDGSDIQKSRYTKESSHLGRDPRDKSLGFPPF